MNERYSVAERAAIIGQYERSGLDLEIFAAWAGIRPLRLRAWQAATQPQPVPALAWIEVEIAAEEEAGEARC